MLAAAASVVFTVAFAIVVQEGERWAQWVSWTTLLVGASGHVAGDGRPARHGSGESEPEFALVGFVLGVGGALGAAVHAAFELSELANPSAVERGHAERRSTPAACMTFAVTGLALGLFGWLILHTGGLPRSAGRLAVGGRGAPRRRLHRSPHGAGPEDQRHSVAALVAGLVLVPGLLPPGRPGALRRTTPKRRDDNASRGRSEASA